MELFGLDSLQRQVTSMGVPGMFRWVCDKFKGAVKRNCDQCVTFDNVYVDCNGLVHSCLSHLVERYSSHSRHGSSTAFPLHAARSFSLQGIQRGRPGRAHHRAHDAASRGDCQGRDPTQVAKQRKLRLQKKCGASNALHCTPVHSALVHHALPQLRARVLGRSRA